MNLSPPPHDTIRPFQTKILKKGSGMFIEVSLLQFNLLFKKFSYQRGEVNGLVVLVGQRSENDISNSAKRHRDVVRGVFLKFTMMY